MSALWSARVLSKDNCRIVVELRAIHPDSGEFQDVKRFALRLLYDEAYGYGADMALKSRGPLGDAITLDQTFDDGFMDGNADRFVEHVAVDVQKPRLDVEQLRDRLDREVAERGIRRDDHEAWNTAWNELWDAFWDEPANLPVATYTIDVTDPQWTAHLDVGSTWESAAY
jgi:hypothetical protein